MRDYITVNTWVRLRIAEYGEKTVYWPYSNTLSIYELKLKLIQSILFKKLNEINPDHIISVNIPTLSTA